MNWLFFISLAILVNAFLDMAFKMGGGKINEVAAALIANGISIIPPLLFFMLLIIKKETIKASPQGIIWMCLAGLAIGVGSIFIIKAFAMGPNLSVISPIYRIATVIVASLIGILILKDTINLKYILGFVLSITGLYLLMTAK